MIKKRLTIFIFLTPDVHKIINSFSWICLTMKIISANKKDKGMNFDKIAKIFNNEYWKYVNIEYPFSTIKSKKLTALTVQAIIVNPNNITKKVFNISFIKFW